MSLAILGCCSNAAIASSTREERQRSDFRQIRQAFLSYMVDHEVYPSSAADIIRVGAAGYTSVPNDGTNFLCQYGFPVIVEHLPELNLRSVGPNGIDDNGEFDDYDMRLGTNVGHWDKVNWVEDWQKFAFIVFMLAIVGSAILLLPVERSFRHCILIALIPGVATLLTALLWPGDFVRSSAYRPTPATALLDHFLIWSWLFSVVVTVFSMPWPWPVSGFKWYVPLLVPAASLHLAIAALWAVPVMVKLTGVYRAWRLAVRLHRLGYDWATMRDGWDLLSESDFSLKHLPQYDDIATTRLYQPHFRALTAISQLRRERDRQ